MYRSPGWPHSVYGIGALEMDLRKAGKGYVLGVASTHQFTSWLRQPAVSGTAEEIMQRLDASAWRRLSAGEGTKGPRLYDWAYLELRLIPFTQVRLNVVFGLVECVGSSGEPHPCGDCPAG
jgi:hypothetical protein